MGRNRGVDRVFVNGDFRVVFNGYREFKVEEMNREGNGSKGKMSLKRH